MVAEGLPRLPSAFAEVANRLPGKSDYGNRQTPAIPRVPGDSCRSCRNLLNSKGVINSIGANGYMDPMPPMLYSDSNSTRA